MRYLISHDFGTSSLKSAIYAEDGALLQELSATYPTFHSFPDWVEQDTEDWWAAFCGNTRRLLEGRRSEDVLCVVFDGVTNACVCCGADGRGLHKAILWQDGRAVEEGREVSALLNTPALQKGRRFMGPGRGCVQLYWVRKHWPDVWKNTDHILLNNSHFVCSRLVGKPVADTMTATAGTYLDGEGRWDEAFLAALGLPVERMPALYDYREVVGTVQAERAEECGLAAGTRVIVGGVDAGMTNTGAGLVRKGDVGMICGTSGTVSEIDGVLLPGTNAVGSVLEWLRSTFCEEEARRAEETGRNVFDLIIETAMEAPPGAGGVLFCPYLSAERGSRMNPKARGSFAGLSLGTTRAEILRAVLEGIALNLNDLAELLRRKGVAFSRVTAVGGLVRNAAMRQLLADVLGVELVTVKHAPWAAATGSAMEAAVTLGLCADLQEAAEKFVHQEAVTVPDAAQHEFYRQLAPLFEELYQSQLSLNEKLFALHRQA